MVRSFLEQQNVITLDWPAKSPCLNPMENVWAEMTRIVYRDGQYRKKADLIAAIHNAAANIRSEFVKGLYTTYNSRLVKVIANQGGSI